MTNNSFTPLFIIGSGRSGTTLVQRILNSHSDICIWGEHAGFLAGVADAYFKFYNGDFYRNVFAPNRKGTSIETHLSDLKNPSVWTAWKNWMTDEEVKKNFRNFLESFFRPSGVNALFCGFKEISYGLNDEVLDFLKEIYPEAKFIFVVRNPKDTILSQIAMFYKGDKSNLARIASEWAVRNKEYLRFSSQNPDKSIVIRYEDLVSDDSVIGKIFGFLGLQYSSQQSEIVFFDAGRGADPRPLSRQNFLNKDELKVINDITIDIASKFNYEAF